MEQQTLKNITNDLKCKRDALALCHEELKKDSDDWNKTIIILSLLNGMLETVKIQLELDTSIFKLSPIFLSSVIAVISSLIKFRDYPRRMEILIQSHSMLTNSLNKYRNHTNINDELIRDYNDSLEKLETSIYPDIRKKYLNLSHKNLLSIMKEENKYFSKIELLQLKKHETPSSDNSCSSDSLPRPTPFIFSRTNVHDVDQEEIV
jgi:hypothetical protein